MPAAKSSPKPKLPRLSPSRINTFVGCPMKYRFQYIESVPTLPSEAMVRGSFVHRVLELLLARAHDQRTNDAAREDFDTAQREFRLRDDWRLLALDDGDQEHFWESSRECVRAYYRIEHPSEAQVVELEKWVSAPLGEFEIAGFIDRLERDTQGLVVSDYKTGAPKIAQYSTDYFRQLTYYALMCETQLNETPHSVRIYYLGGPKDQYTKQQRVVSQVVTTDTLNEVRDTARRVFGAIEAGKTTGEFATNVTKLCEWCDFREWCPAHGGDIGNAKAEASVRVQLRRRQVGLPESA
jgi:putative RecB family exonuclease